jgi:hypothetical protein
MLAEDPSVFCPSTFSNFPVILAILLDKLGKTPVQTVATLGPMVQFSPGHKP